MKNVIKFVVFVAYLMAAPARGEEPTVVVETVHPIEISDEISYPARVTSKVNALVRSDNDGVVTGILVHLGEKVTKGTKLLEIKNMDPVYEYVAVKQTSPVAGVVSAFDVAEGTNVKKGQTLLTVIDPSRLRINIEVVPSDLGGIKTDLPGIFEFTESSSKTSRVDVKVSGVSPLIDPATGTASVELVSAQNKTVLAPGLLGKVLFQINRRQGFQLPEQALLYRGTDTMVRTVKDGVASLVKVAVGTVQKGRAEIISGLSPGNKVVIRASGFVADGQKVNVQESNIAKQ